MSISLCHTFEGLPKHMWYVFIFQNVAQIPEGLQRKPNHPTCKWLRLVALAQHSFKFSNHDNQKCQKTQQ